MAATNYQEATEVSVSDRVRLVINSLPVLTSDDVPLNETCPICLVSFGSILKECAEYSMDEGGSLGGVTKLLGCGHVFCRNDLAEWIRSMHGSCPTCRHAFLDVTPPSESDDESSDGGEYIPDPSDDEDEDDGDEFFENDVDVFTDGEWEVDVDDLGFDAELNSRLGALQLTSSGDESDDYEDGSGSGSESGSGSGSGSDNAEGDVVREDGEEWEDEEEDLDADGFDDADDSSSADHPDPEEPVIGALGEANLVHHNFEPPRSVTPDEAHDESKPSRGRCSLPR